MCSHRFFGANHAQVRNYTKMHLLWCTEVAAHRQWTFKLRECQKGNGDHFWHHTCFPQRGTCAVWCRRQWALLIWALSFAFQIELNGGSICCSFLGFTAMRMRRLALALKLVWPFWRSCTPALISWFWRSAFLQELSENPPVAFLPVARNSVGNKAFASKKALQTNIKAHYTIFWDFLYFSCQVFPSWTSKNFG